MADIVEEVAKATQLTRPESRVVVDRILESLAEDLSRGERYEIRNFGTFKTRIVSGKVGRHLATGVSVALPPMRKVIFKPGRAFPLVELEAEQPVPIEPDGGIKETTTGA